MLKRLLPGKMEIWKRKRDKRLERKRQAKEKKIKEWVSYIRKIANIVWDGTPVHIIIITWIVYTFTCTLQISPLNVSCIGS